MHANYLRLEGEKRDRFVTQVQDALSRMDEAIVDRLLRLDWRELITGGWFAGLKNWTQFLHSIGDLLLESRTCYAGQGYCFALARFNQQDSMAYLQLYLDIYLPRIECQYDQHWALSALLWLDKVNQTDNASVYLQPDGLWERYIAEKKRFGEWDITVLARHFEASMDFCVKWFDQTSSVS